MTKYKVNCKYCSKEIIISNEEDGYYHAYELANANLHICKARHWRESRYQG